MAVIGWIIWTSCVLFFLIHLLLAVNSSDGGTRILAKRYAILLVIGLTLTAIGPFSKFHLLWWAPAMWCLNLIYFWISFQCAAAKFVEQLSDTEPSEKDSLIR